jgi:hypothetical protein
MPLDQVKSWLDQMNLNYRVIDDKIILFYNLEGIRFSVIITIGSKWIRIAALIIRSEDVPSQHKEQLFKELLQQNWLLNDVTYSVDPNGAVFSENDMPLGANFESFQSEFGAVIYGVTNFFVKIGPKYGLISPANEYTS